MEAPYRINIQSIFLEAWQQFKTRPLFFIAITVFTFILSSVFGELANRVRDIYPLFGLPLSLCTSFIEALVMFGYLSIHMHSVRGEKPVFSDLFVWSPFFWRYLGTTILFGLMITVGLIALIVPGLVLISTFFFSSFIAIDRGLYPRKALMESIKLTQGIRLQIFQFIVSIIIINLAGALLFGIGLFITYPLSVLASLFLYRELLLFRSNALNKEVFTDVNKLT